MGLPAGYPPASSAFQSAKFTGLESKRAGLAVGIQGGAKGWIWGKRVRAHTGAEGQHSFLLLTESTYIFAFQT